MLWVKEWSQHLPPKLVLTCGGWFGFLAGEERRAGRALKRSGLEWVARLSQSPRKLGPRYIHGARSSLVVGGQTVARRLL
jgi:N-acetylglucosaminyldiphosphoundecaprenol N-acetyl-beta-D-mannosaminyltransferase